MNNFLKIISKNSKKISVLLEVPISLIGSLSFYLFLTEKLSVENLGLFGVCFAVSAFCNQVLFSSLVVYSQSKAWLINLKSNKEEIILIRNLFSYISLIIFGISIFLFIFLKSNYIFAIITGMVSSIGISAQSLSINYLNVKAKFRDSLFITFRGWFYFLLLIFLLPANPYIYPLVQSLCFLLAIYPSNTIRFISFKLDLKFLFKSKENVFKRRRFSYLSWSFIVWIRQNIAALMLPAIIGLNGAGTFLVINSYCYNLPNKFLSIIRTYLKPGIYKYFPEMKKNLSLKKYKIIFVSFTSIFSVIFFLISIIIFKNLDSLIPFTIIQDLKVINILKNNILLAAIMIPSSFVFICGELVLDVYQSLSKWNLLMKIKTISNLLLIPLIYLLAKEFGIFGVVISTFIYVNINYFFLLTKLSI